MALKAWDSTNYTPGHAVATWDNSVTNAPFVNGDYWKFKLPIGGAYIVTVNFKAGSTPVTGGTGQLLHFNWYDGNSGVTFDETTTNTGAFAYPAGGQASSGSTTLDPSAGNVMGVANKTLTFKLFDTAQNYGTPVFPGGSVILLNFRATVAPTGWVDTISISASQV